MLIRPVTVEDHPALLALWQRTPGVRLRDEDGFEAFCAYLARNPGLSSLVEIDGKLVGCLMAGHDGRRGYLQHLAVEPERRRQGVARALLQHTLGQLAALGIRKSHVFVLQDEPQALAFWLDQEAWGERDDIRIFSTREVP
ncbi:GNAT family N-acetyltransferase [Pseudomonas sp. LRF_L74]|uniref:GNAT family N-acetyltransferase n=1 Tax=Pseudomonas sp. LRF_L74 TaxID=3369422 RepID=UPI003F5EDF27